MIKFEKIFLKCCKLLQKHKTARVRLLPQKTVQLQFCDKKCVCNTYQYSISLDSDRQHQI